MNWVKHAPPVPSQKHIRFLRIDARPAKFVKPPPKTLKIAQTERFALGARFTKAWMATPNANHPGCTAQTELKKTNGGAPMVPTAPPSTIRTFVPKVRFVGKAAINP